MHIVVVLVFLFVCLFVFVFVFVFSFIRVLFYMLLSKVRVVLGLEDQRNGVLVVLKVDCYVVQLFCILLLYVLKKSLFFMFLTNVSSWLLYVAACIISP